jgi:hypothetical protein
LVGQTQAQPSNVDAPPLARKRDGVRIWTHLVR